MRKRPHYATRAEAEADTRWYWEWQQVGVVAGVVIVAAGVVVLGYMLGG